MMLSSIEVMQAAQIEREVLNNYIIEGLLPRPLINPDKGDLTNPRQIGYFPEEILSRIERINQLKLEGYELGDIAKQLELEGYPVKRTSVPQNVVELNRPQLQISTDQTLAVDQSKNYATRQPPQVSQQEFSIKSENETFTRNHNPKPAQPEPQKPASENTALLEFLEKRDAPIRNLLKQELPALTEVAILSSDLQSSDKIATELPPEEYFQLVNQIWSTMDPIFRKYSAIHGKHAKDGMVTYFLPQTESNYILNALMCAYEMKVAIRRISKDWQLRKNWTQELYLNSGLSEGQEWIGLYKFDTKVEFTVLGDTINHAKQLSDLANDGSIWATKNFLGGLPANERHHIKFGIRRLDTTGREVIVNSYYSRVSELSNVNISTNKVDLVDILSLPVTEIFEISN